MLIQIGCRIGTYFFFRVYFRSCWYWDILMSSGSNFFWIKKVWEVLMSSGSDYFWIKKCWCRVALIFLNQKVLMSIGSDFSESKSVDVDWLRFFWIKLFWSHFGAEWLRFVRNQTIFVNFRCGVAQFFSESTKFSKSQQLYMKYIFK